MTTLKPVSGTPRMRLVCIPHAGGNPEIFLPWADGISDGVELLAVRLPGHGPRIADPPIDHWDALVADVLEGLENYLGEPHAFYGHCFGGRLAYELTHFTLALPRAQTKRLLMSTCRSPDTPTVAATFMTCPTHNSSTSCATWGHPIRFSRTRAYCDSCCQPCGTRSDWPNCGPIAIKQRSVCPSQLSTDVKTPKTVGRAWKAGGRSAQKDVSSSKCRVGIPSSKMIHPRCST